MPSGIVSSSELAYKSPSYPSQEEISSLATPPSYQPLEVLVPAEWTPSASEPESHVDFTPYTNKDTQKLIELVETLLESAGVAQAQKQRDRAIKILGFIYETCKNYLTLFSPSMAVAQMLTTLGIEYLHIDEPGFAENTLLYALNLYQQLDDESSLDVARTWYYLGDIAYRADKLDAAMAAFDSARDICKSLGQLHLYYLALVSIAAIQRDWGEYQEAEETYMACLKIQEAHVDLSLSRSNRIATLTKLGELHYELGEFQTASQWYEKALQIDPNSLNHALALMSQSRLPMLPEEALALLDQSVVIKQKLDAEMPLDAWTATHYARIYLALNLTAEAASMLKQSMDLQRLAKEQDQPLRAETWMYQGALLRLEGNLMESRHALKDALVIATEYYGAMSPTLPGQLHLALAKTHQAGMNVGKAREEAEGALLLFKRHGLDDSHPWVVDANNLLASLIAVSNSTMPSSSIPSLWHSPTATAEVGGRATFAQTYETARQVTP